MGRSGGSGAKEKMFKRQHNRAKGKLIGRTGRKGEKKGQEKRWEMGEDNLQERKKTLFQKGTTQEKLSPKGHARKNCWKKKNYNWAKRKQIKEK